MDILNSLERELLIASWIANNFSTNAHNSKRVIIRKLSPRIKNNQQKMKKIDKAFKKLTSKGYLTKHPTGEMTYNVSIIGKEYLNTLKE